MDRFKRLASKYAENKKPDTIFICKYGQTGLPICVDPGHEYCKLKSMQSKKCDFREVINYSEYKKLLQKLEDGNNG